MDLSDHAAFWLELHPDLVPLVLERNPEMRSWRSWSGRNLPEHLLSWPGPFPGKYAVISAMLRANPEWTLSHEVMDEAVRRLALTHAQAQVDPFTEKPVYEPGEDRPMDPGDTRDLAERFGASLKPMSPADRARRLQRIGRVFQLEPRSGGPFHRQLRQAFEAHGVASSVDTYAKDPRPSFKVPQSPIPAHRPAPRAKYEEAMVKGRPLEAARRVWELGMTPEAKGKMLAKLLSHRLGVARRARRRGRAKTRWEARSARKFEYVDFRRFMQALAITAPSGSVGQVVMLPSLQAMMEDAMLEDDLDLFHALHPGQAPADVSRRLTKRALKIARQFAPLDQRLVATLAQRPLPYTSRHAATARHALRAHFSWEDPGLGVPSMEQEMALVEEQRLLEARRLESERVENERLEEEKRLKERLAERRRQEKLRKQEAKRQRLAAKKQARLKGRRRLGLGVMGA